MSTISKIEVPTGWLRPASRRTGSARRAGVLSDLQLVCGVGVYELDVLVRELDRPHGIELIGQLTQADQINVPAVRVGLTLVRPDEARPVSSTRSDSFGEFAFGRLPSAVYGLRVGDADDSPCVLVWDGDAR